MANFNIGDYGLALTFTPQSPIPAGSGNVRFKFLGSKSGAKVAVAATSIAGGLQAQYILQSGDFTVADTYYWELLYDPPGGSSSSVGPYATICVGTRLF